MRAEEKQIEEKMYILVIETATGEVQRREIVRRVRGEREKRAKSREQRAESREQRAKREESREQRREQSL